MMRKNRKANAITVSEKPIAATLAIFNIRSNMFSPMQTAARRSLHAGTANSFLDI